jgi:hypothetical protein
MLSGCFKASFFFKLSSMVVALVITFMYILAQYKHQEKRVTWISACAEHYP